MSVAYWPEPYPNMSHRTANRFNQREVSRALRAARRAGETVERVEIDPATGRISVIIAKSGEAATGRNTNPWDEVLKDGSKAKRTA
jgi:hypothetical protein